MVTLIYVGWKDLPASLSQKLEGSPDYRLKEVPEPGLEAGLQEADVFLVGPGEPDPVRIVQRVHAGDRYLSILVLAHPAEYGKVKQALLFAPFIGKNTVCISYSEGLDPLPAFGAAALRTRQRRAFSRINKVAAATSIASASVRVENLGIFLEEAPIAALLVNEQHAVIALNRKAKMLLRSEENRSYLLRDFFPELSLQPLQVARLAASSEPMILQAGDLFFELHLSEVGGENGKPLFLLLLNDITEQKRREAVLMESEALFRFLAEAMPQKIWTADEKGELNFFNQGWTSYTGMSREALKGWGWLRAIHPEDAEANKDAWQHAIDTGNDFEFEQRIRDHKGEYRWHLVRGIARKDESGKVLLWVGTNTDIHEQKEFAGELEKKVKERTFELEKSNSELEQFVYVTSHDLQEPVRKIRMFSGMLQESLKDVDEASGRYIDKINATAVRMGTLLRDLLRFTRVNQEDPFTETDLNEVLAQVLVDLELVISGKGARVESEPLPVIRAIPVQMQQLLYNLVHNALKFSREGTPPVIRVTAQVAPPETLLAFPHLQPGRTYHEIVVRDNGIGFSPEYAEQIFNIFQRLHGRSEYSGTGIGLALCKRVVTNHYGHIYAQSELDRGASFHILLPER